MFLVSQFVEGAANAETGLTSKIDIDTNISTQNYSLCPPGCARPTGPDAEAGPSTYPNGSDFLLNDGQNPFNEAFVSRRLVVLTQEEAASVSGLILIRLRQTTAESPPAGL